MTQIYDRMISDRCRSRFLSEGNGESARIRGNRVYKSIISENTTLVLSTDSDLSRFLKGMAPER